MPSTIVDLKWSFLVDEREHIGWAEYVSQWLADQVPSERLTRAVLTDPVVYTDAPWATACLCEALNA